jgi:hypothetical protein
VVTRRAKLAAVLTALLVVFLAVAIYSPLHRHQAGDPYQCSLNNIDQSVVEHAGALPVLLVTLSVVGPLWAEPEPQPAEIVVPVLAARGPPVFRVVAL